MESSGNSLIAARRLLKTTMMEPNVVEPTAGLLVASIPTVLDKIFDCIDNRRLLKLRRVCKLWDKEIVRKVGREKSHQVCFPRREPQNWNVLDNLNLESESPLMQHMWDLTHFCPGNPTSNFNQVENEFLVKNLNTVQFAKHLSIKKCCSSKEVSEVLHRLLQRASFVESATLFRSFCCQKEEEPGVESLEVGPALNIKSLTIGGGTCWSDIKLIATRSTKLENISGYVLGHAKYLHELNLLKLVRSADIDVFVAPNSSSCFSLRTILQPELLITNLNLNIDWAESLHEEVSPYRFAIALLLQQTAQNLQSLKTISLSMLDALVVPVRFPKLRRLCFEDPLPSCYLGPSHWLLPIFPARGSGAKMFPALLEVEIGFLFFHEYFLLNVDGTINFPTAKIVKWRSCMDGAVDEVIKKKFPNSTVKFRF